MNSGEYRAGYRKGMPGMPFFDVTSTAVVYIGPRNRVVNYLAGSYDLQPPSKCKYASIFACQQVNHQHLTLINLIASGWLGLNEFVAAAASLIIEFIIKCNYLQLCG